MKIADLSGDLEVLRQARACAKELFSSGLRGEIRRLFHKTGGEGVVL